MYVDSCVSLCVHLFIVGSSLFLQIEAYLLFSLFMFFALQVLTACGDGTSRCFDSRTGTLFREFKGHESIVTSVQVAWVVSPAWSTSMLSAF